MQIKACPNLSEWCPDLRGQSVGFPGPWKKRCINTLSEWSALGHCHDRNFGWENSQKWQTSWQGCRHERCCAARKNRSPDQKRLDLENGSFGGGGNWVPQQEGVPQRPSQLQAQPCLLRCTWGGTNNHQLHYKLLGVPGAGTNNHQFHCKLGKILPLLVSHCWMSSIMVLRNMIQQHIQSVLFNQSSLDFCCQFHEDFLELPGTDVYLLRLGAPVKLSNCSNRKCSFFFH